MATYLVFSDDSEVQTIMDISQIRSELPTEASAQEIMKFVSTYDDPHLQKMIQSCPKYLNLSQIPPSNISSGSSLLALSQSLSSSSPSLDEEIQQEPGAGVGILNLPKPLNIPFIHEEMDCRVTSAEGFRFKWKLMRIQRGIGHRAVMFWAPELLGITDEDDSNGSTRPILDDWSCLFESKPYKCSFCKKSFKQMAMVRRHQKIHQGGTTTHNCPFRGCAIPYRCLTSMKKHFRDVHNPKAKILDKRIN